MDCYPNIEEFYSAVPARRFSGEANYGVWWVEGGNPAVPCWRVSYVRDTEEVYAVRSGDGPVRVLGTFPVDPDAQPEDVYYSGLDSHLDGWGERCGQLNSLAWITERLTQPPARHEHAWGPAEKILRGDVWTDKSVCFCGARRLVHSWCGKHGEIILLPTRRFPALYRCSECEFEEVMVLQAQECPPLPTIAGHRCIGCGARSVTLVGVLSEAEYANWRDGPV